MKKRISLPLLLCAGLLVYALVTPAPEFIPEPAPTEPDARSPLSYAHDVTLRSYGPEGTLADRTEARILRRFDDNAVVELTAPQRWGHRGSADWVASARTGILYEKRDALQLNGDVELRYTADGAVFSTQSMLINLRFQTARSLAPVRAWQGENETHAQMLTANLNLERATLTGNVRSVYVPER